MSLWRKNCWCLALTAIFLLSLVSAVRINEVELNPESNDVGKEWIELYSENEMSLENYSIKNNDNQTISLTGSFSNFFIINFSGQWLDNEDEKVLLLFNNAIIDETIIFEDASNDNRTWQYCNGNWNFTNSSKWLENLCQEGNLPSNNQTTNQSNQTQNQQNQTIYLELEYDEEVEIGEFDVGVKAFNLKDENYDIKVYVEDDEKIISETYDENESRWRSSNYYVNEIFSGKGNKSKTLKLKIDEDFSGNAEIKARIRKSGTTSIIAEFSDNIKISAKEGSMEIQEDAESRETEKQAGKENKAGITGNVIKLNAKDIKSLESKEYKSKTQYIKEYAVYGFALFCVFVIIVLIIKKL